MISVRNHLQQLSGNSFLDTGFKNQDICWPWRFVSGALFCPLITRMGTNYLISFYCVSKYCHIDEGDIWRRGMRLSLLDIVAAKQ